jgi:hypothetical protein
VQVQHRRAVAQRLGRHLTLGTPGVDTLREMARLILHQPAEARPMGRRVGRSLERES